MLHRFFLMLALLAPAFPAASASATDTRIRKMTEVMFKNYPPRALAAGEQGAVFFVVTIDNHGQPTSCDVTHGSGHPLLDQETCQLIVQHATFKPVIGKNGKLKRSVHEGVVNWTIPGRDPVEIKPILVIGAKAPPGQICKNSMVTGSLVATNRQCMTRREWDRTAQEYQEFWGQFQGRHGSSGSGPDNGDLTQGN